MKNSNIVVIILWMILAVVNIIGLFVFPAPNAFFGICGCGFGILNFVILISFFALLRQEFRERKYAKLYPADSDIEETPVEEVPAPKKKRAKAKPIEEE